MPKKYKISKSNKYYKKFKKHCPNYEFVPTVIDPVKEIYAIGDLHGDLEVTINSLYLTRVIDKNYNQLVDDGVIQEDILKETNRYNHEDAEELGKRIVSNLNWVGGNKIVVQVGDQIDRCRPYKKKCDEEGATIEDEASDITILVLMTELDKKAISSSKKGRVISLLGNHELMNVKGNMNYVSRKGLEQFGDDNDIHRSMDKRKKLFERGNIYSKYLGCTRNSSVIIGDYLFVHAGIIPEFLEKLRNKSNINNYVNNRKFLRKINRGVRKWLLEKINKKNINYIIKSNKSMFWTRILGSIPPGVDNENPVCQNYLKPILDFSILKEWLSDIHLNIFYIEGSNDTCIEKDRKHLFRIDNGSSKAFNKFDVLSPEVSEERKIQVLKITYKNGKSTSEIIRED